MTTVKSQKEKRERETMEAVLGSLNFLLAKFSRLRFWKFSVSKGTVFFQAAEELQFDWSISLRKPRVVRMTRACTRRLG